ncbi:uncharacterized protein LY79DRAFT_174828 [Colletotrichum navitas]|uniref:Uncharacterized protein n=1 Tax=Colletotrichum navitas TaxID=681940 RepID=A0AAD8V6R3_9PEZI|nr:uncharacterized protein LY79DRAFT_174828 [Colletotrichum navitas]KAK1593615.1 hypothetical protein LY79DRAFT_174828 [Colletotrichum navitas]
MVYTYACAVRYGPSPRCWEELIATVKGPLERTQRRIHRRPLFPGDMRLWEAKTQRDKHLGILTHRLTGGRYHVYFCKIGLPFGLATAGGRIVPPFPPHLQGAQPNLTFGKRLISLPGPSTGPNPASEWHVVVSVKPHRRGSHLIFRPASMETLLSRYNTYPGQEPQLIISSVPILGHRGSPSRTSAYVPVGRNNLPVYSVHYTTYPNYRFAFTPGDIPTLPWSFKNLRCGVTDCQARCHTRARLPSSPARLASMDS